VKLLRLSEDGSCGGVRTVTVELGQLRWRENRALSPFFSFLFLFFSFLLYFIKLVMGSIMILDSIV